MKVFWIFIDLQKTVHGRIIKKNYPNKLIEWGENQTYLHRLDVLQKLNAMKRYKHTRR